MNKVILIGNLTRDPELSQTGSGVSFCRMTIAVNRPFAGAGGEREADFFDITVWRNQAENCHKFLKKGNKVCIVGYLQRRAVEQQDGTKRYFTDINADEVEFLTPKGESQGGGHRDDYAPTAPPERNTNTERKSIKDNPPISDDELPF